MAQGIGVEEIIDIQTEVQSGGSIRAEFGTGLLLTTNAAIPAGGSLKCQRFGSLSAVSDTFGVEGATVDIEEDAKVWFAADPAPKALYIGRWAADDVNTSLNGGRLTYVAATVQGYTAGALRIAGTDVTGINFAGSAGDTPTNAASTLQTAIRGGVSSLNTLTVTWDSEASRFEINYGTTGDIGAIEPSQSGGTFDDLAALLNLQVTTNASTTATYFQGSDDETIPQAVSRCSALALGGAPSALMIGTDCPVTYDSTRNSRTDLETTAQAGDYMTARLDTSTGALAADDTTSALYTTFNNSRSKVIPVYSRGTTIGTESQAPRPDIGIMAKLSSQNFDLPQSIITLVPKPLEGVGTTDITSTQLAVLQAKQASVLTTVGGLPSLLGGWTGKSGVWADAQWWLMWLKNEMEKSIFEAMRSSKRLSNAQLRDTINGVMAKAVNSGGAKLGGVVSDVIKHDIRAVTGNHDFNGTMPNGYVLWVDPPQSQTAADRAARISRFKVWIAPSEAIHSVSGGIILSG